MLVEQIDQAASLQMQAEKEADIAMQQLEDFINDQEELVSSRTPSLRLIYVATSRVYGLDCLKRYRIVSFRIVYSLPCKCECQLNIVE